MKDHVVLITFQHRSWFWDGLAFMLLPFKLVTTKTYFRHYDIAIKTLCTKSYSRVSNRRDSPLINYSFFATLSNLIQHSKFINFGEFCQPPLLFQTPAY